MTDSGDVAKVDTIEAVGSAAVTYVQRRKVAVYNLLGSFDPMLPRHGPPSLPMGIVWKRGTYEDIYSDRLADFSALG
jgi:hypothetical protein